MFEKMTVAVDSELGDAVTALRALSRGCDDPDSPGMLARPPALRLLATLSTAEADAASLAAAVTAAEPTDDTTDS